MGFSTDSTSSAAFSFTSLFSASGTGGFDLEALEERIHLFGFFAIG